MPDAFFCATEEGKGSVKRSGPGAQKGGSWRHMGQRPHDRRAVITTRKAEEAVMNMSRKLLAPVAVVTLAGLALTVEGIGRLAGVG